MNSNTGKLFLTLAG